jgi:hypothetical protein
MSHFMVHKFIFSLSKKFRYIRHLQFSASFHLESGFLKCTFSGGLGKNPHIALEFEPKDKDPQKQQERERVRKVLGEASGKVNSLVDFDNWPKNEICEFLQEEIGHMDFAIVADILEANWEYRTLYP